MAQEHFKSKTDPNWEAYEKDKEKPSSRFVEGRYVAYMGGKLVETGKRRRVLPSMQELVSFRNKDGLIHRIGSENDEPTEIPSPLCVWPD